MRKIAPSKYQETINGIAALEVNEVYIYTEKFDYRRMAASVHRWRDVGKIPGVYKTFSWDNKFYIVRVRPKDGTTTEIKIDNKETIARNSCG